MKKSILIVAIAIVAVIAGISSTVLVQSNNNTEDVNMTINAENLANDSEKIMVTTTTNVITDLVENIGGDHVQGYGTNGTRSGSSSLSA